MAEALNAVEFLKSSEARLVIDVRSQGEHGQGHIPGAVNIPLLDTESRAIVGTVYKQEGREAAVLKGFELAGGDFHLKIRKVMSLDRGKEVCVYCWRGGMRSNIFAWLLSIAGYRVTLLKGGYKAYRNWALSTLQQDRDILILGGYTGSGKTDLLHELKRGGECIIDLEALAHHRGSAFGALGQLPQPTNEQFENTLAQAWSRAENKRVWLENESRMIGVVKIPDHVFDQVRSAPVIAVNVSLEERVQRILAEYGKFPREALMEATLKIKKRLGDLRWRQANQLLLEDNVEAWVGMMLDYYDRFYAYGTAQRAETTVYNMDFTDESLSDRALKLLELSRTLNYEPNRRNE